jgi:hypothetical protein
LRLELQDACSKRGEAGQESFSDEFDANLFANLGEWRFYRDSNTLKIDLLEFYGRLQTEEFLEWHSAIEKLFDYRETLENKRVKQVATRLRVYASAWWDKVQEIRLRKGKPKISSWEQMKSRLKEKFLLADSAQMAFSQTTTFAKILKV